MIDPAITAASLASAEAAIPGIEARVREHAGNPLEQDAQTVLEAAHSMIGNLRQILTTAERRTT